MPKYVQEFYSGLIRVGAFDKDETVRIGNIIRDALAQNGLDPNRASISWMLYQDGKATTDANWNGKQWRTLKGNK